MLLRSHSINSQDLNIVNFNAKLAGYRRSIKSAFSSKVDLALFLNAWTLQINLKDEWTCKKELEALPRFVIGGSV